MHLLKQLIAHFISQLLLKGVGVSKSKSAGHQTVLTYDEEKEIVATCQAMQDLGFGLTREMVVQVVADYLVLISRPNLWPQLSERKPEHLSKKRAEGVTRAVVDEWIDTVQKAFEEHKQEQ